jgi:hypothetical protein
MQYSWCLAGLCLSGGSRYAQIFSYFYQVQNLAGNPATSDYQVVKWSSGQVVKGPKGQKKSPNPEIALQVEAWRKVDNVKALRFHLYRQARIIQTTQ